MKFFRVGIRESGQRSLIDKVIFEQSLKGREVAIYGDI